MIYDIVKRGNPCGSFYFFPHRGRRGADQHRANSVVGDGSYDNRTFQQYPPRATAPQPPTRRQLSVGLSTGLRRSLLTYDRSARAPPRSTSLASLHRLTA